MFIFLLFGRSKTIFSKIGSNCFTEISVCMMIVTCKKWWQAGFLPSFLLKDFHRNLDSMPFPEDREACDLSDLSKVYKFTHEVNPGKHAVLAVCCIGDFCQL